MVRKAINDEVKVVFLFRVERDFIDRKLWIVEMVKFSIEIDPLIAS